MEYFYSSAIATLFAEILTLPLAIMRTTKHIGENDVMKHVGKTLKCSPYAVVTQIVSTSSKYTTYRMLGEKGNNRLMNATIAGVVAGVMIQPFEVINLHKQTGRDNYVLWRGMSKTMLRNVMSAHLFVPTYDYFHKKTENSLKSGVISGLICSAVISPVDYLKTRHIYGMKYGNVFTGCGFNCLRVTTHFTITMVIIDLMMKRL